MTRALIPTTDAYALWHRLQDDGGYTVDPDTGEVPTTGYAVSLPSYTRVYTRGQLRPADVVDGLQDARILQRVYPHWRIYAGAWDNGRGLQELDPTIVVPDASEAYRLARKFGQEAYFDLARGENVKVWDASA